MAKHVASQPLLLTLLSDQASPPQSPLSYTLLTAGHSDSQRQHTLQPVFGNVAFLLDHAKRSLLIQNESFTYTKGIVILASARNEAVRLYRLAESSPGNSEESPEARLDEAGLDLILSATKINFIELHGIVISSRLLRSLRRAKNLRSLCLDAPLFASNQPLAFRNLKRLSLTNIKGKPQIWKDVIGKMLLYNSELEHLTISFHKDVPPDKDDLPAFFGAVCMLYHTISDTKLNLKTLRLGRGIEFPRVAVLKKMLNLTALEDIHINSAASYAPYAYIMPPGMTFHTPWKLLLSRTIAPRLRRISLYQYPQHEWDETQCLIERAVDEGIELRFGHLGRKQDSMPEPLLANRDLDGILSLQKVQYPRPDPGDAPHICDQSLAGHPWITHLIYQIGRGVEVGIWHSPHHTFFPRFCTAIAKLPNLEAIWVPNQDSQYGSWGQGTRYAFTREQLFENATELAHKASSKLRYIRFGDRAWRARRPRGSTKDRFKGYIEGDRGFYKRRLPPVLEPLDAWEDEMECPSFFHATGTMEWSEVTNHCEWRET